MGLTISTDITTIIGIVYSAIGIALAVTQCFIRKVHSRALDYIQWAYLLTLINASVTIQFSSQLSVGSSVIQPSQESLTGFYCLLDSYVCARAFAISFLVFLVGILIIMRFVTIAEKVKEKGITFPRVYRLFKGLFKWFYLPLIYLSISLLLVSQGQISTKIAALVFVGVLVVFPFVQLLLYRLYDPEGEDNFIKWLEFTNYLKAGLFALFIVLVQKYSTTAYYYYISFLIVIYATFFLLKHNFRYARVGAIFYISGEVLFYFLYSLYVSNSQWLNLYFLDLFILGIILLIDIIYNIMESVQFIKEWKSIGSEVIPEESDPVRKKNRYQVEEGADLKHNNSRENLNESRASSSNVQNIQNSSSINKAKNNKVKGK